MSKNYRKIWEEYNGKKIPKGYHIHHIDGNHSNNDPNNLICCSPQEHWNIHFQQGDPVAINGKFIQGANIAGRKGGAAGKGKPISKDHRVKLSESMKACYKRKGVSWNKGRKHTEEAKNKISEGTKGEMNPMFGRNHSDESKKMMSESIKKSFETGERIPHPTVHNEETKRKISQGRKAYYANGGVSAWANVYDVTYKDVVYQSITKAQLLEEFQITDRQFTTAYVYCKRNPGKSHPKTSLMIISKGKIS
jgi:hypothetical protein